MSPFLHLVDNRDVEGLAAALEHWKEDPARRQRDLDNLLIRIADQNPNHRARFANLTQMALMALDAGADINAPGVFGTPVSLATGWGNLELVGVLVERGAQLNNETLGVPLLHQAVKRADRKLLTALLDAGAQVDKTDKNGQSALFAACKPSLRTMLRLLVKRGADPLAVDAKGNTLWHAMMSNMAMETKKPDCLPLMDQLIRWGVDAFQANVEGKTPRDLAQTLRINLLEDLDPFLAQVQAKALNGETPIPTRRRSSARF